MDVAVVYAPEDASRIREIAEALGRVGLRCLVDRTIPPGQTASYAEIAARIGAPAATRAVAQACGANALAVAIPCHRVVRSDGALSGYRWGVERKRELLRREAQA